MAQKTNLNISPYYDDFDSDKNFYKVLFKPGFPVQSRELTNLQSILQNQVEDFGSHMFKEGSMVVPGNVSFDGQFYALKVNSLQFGIDISVYINNFLGKVIVGQTSGTTAKIQKIVFPNESSEVEYITLYVKYLESNQNFEFDQFLDGESFAATENVVYGNTTISEGSVFATAIDTDATSIGSAVSIGEGIYFVRGYFVNVNSQNIILDFYTNTPSYRVGLKVSELITTAKDDESLYDNAKGFTNYAAPGADRLNIDLTLTKKLLTDTNDTDFIELLRLQDGRVKKVTSKTEYNQIRDYIAERTFDESGNYTIDPFEIKLTNSLNNRLGNDGAFFNNQLTEQKNTPSDNLACLKISPGKSYVCGYDIEKVATEIVDVEKPRDTEKISNATIPFEMGNILRVNNVTGLPKVRERILLYSEFGSTNSQIGEARVYSFNLTDSQYSNQETNWDLRLYDVQTYVRLTLNKPVNSSVIKESFFVEGKSSGASGFSIADGSSGTLSARNDFIFLRQTSGTFVKGDQLIINGIDSPRSVKEVKVFNTQNIKSVKQADPFGYGTDFSANSNLELFNIPNGISQISISQGSLGVSTVTSTGKQFVGINTNTILRYQQSGLSTESYNRVSSVASDLLSFEVTAISNDVAGIFNGSLPSSNIQVNGFLGAPILGGFGGLYAPLLENDISSIDLSNSNLFVTEQLVGKTISGSALTLTTTTDLTDVPNGNWTTFDQERYSIGYSDGTIGQLSSDSFNLNGNTLTFTGLDNGSNIVANVTAIKSQIKSKIKTYNRSSILEVSGSQSSESGSSENSSKNDGLEPNDYYGLRVQDREISLNHPDVVKVLAIYESLDNNSPSLDQITFTSTANVTQNSIIGENIIGNISGAVARIVLKPATNILSIIYLNENKFSVGESVTFEESNINTIIEAISAGSFKDITSLFKLNRGQKNQYYDYSRIVRNKGTQNPSRKLLIVFDHYTVPTNDTGDVFTVNSYDSDRFTTDIPYINGELRASDTLDFRPRVAFFDPAVTTDRSPFDFNARTSTFDSEPSRILASGEGSIVSQSFYLPRIDKIYLDISGKFVVDKGVSAKLPKPPVKNGELLELATLILPPYLYSPNDAQLILTDNKRYTMRDIGYLEDRVENLEQSTSLSLLELNTQTLQIRDSEGKNKFKTGFFVDDFSDSARFNENLSSTTVDTVSKTLVSDISRDSLESLIATEENISPENFDFNDNMVLLDPSIQKTGDVLTLAYDEIDWLEQPFATKVENVNPFNIVVYTGTIQLQPQVDNWTRTVQLQDRNVNRGVTTRNEVNLINNLSHTLRHSITNSITQNLNTVVTQRQNIRSIRGSASAHLAASLVGTIEGTDTTSSFRSSTDTSRDISRSSSTASGSFDTVDTTIRNEVVGNIDERFMRSRNTEFVASGLKSNTRFYQFLDGNNNVDVIPKLIEISNSSSLENFGSSSAFEVGETVVGLSEDGVERIKFRLCTPNHKEGNFKRPSSVYNQNPYIKTESISSNSYSPTSKVLNVDTSSLARVAQGKYFGYITKGMQLVGQTSGAIAFVKDIRLISDNYGDLIGSFFIRDPNSRPRPTTRISTGTKTYRITSSPTNDKGIPGSNSVSFAETNYTANITQLQFQATRTSAITRTTINNTVNSTIDSQISSTVNLRTNATTTVRRTTTAEYVDPLAQTFTVGGNIQVKSDIDTNDDTNGVFLTSVDLFFASVDSGNAEVRVEVRTTLLGTPTTEILGKPVILRPRGVTTDGNFTTQVELINTSPTGEVATNVKFPEPIFLAPGREYAIVIISDKSDGYELWTAVMGEKTANTKSLPDVDSVRYTKQFALGTLFKSQNGSIWTTNQYQDLKFKLYKAQFSTNTGTAFFYNPPLSESNGYVPNLVNNPLLVVPKTGRIGITTLTESEIIGILTSGRKLSGSNGSGGSAVIVGQGSSVANTTITDGGQNYPTSVSNEVVDTFNVTGSGQDLKLVITTTDGVITGAAHSTIHYGTGYRTGDIVGIAASATSSNTGRDARITVDIGEEIDTLYLTNVQGEFGGTGSGKEFAVGAGVSYYDNSGTLVAAAGTTITSFVADGGVNSGNYMLVDHYNHGMYSTTNKLSLSGIEPNVPSTNITSKINFSEVSTISVANTSSFGTFEGQNVSAAYTGYVKVGNEIIGYDGVGNGSLSISATNGRAIDDTRAIDHQTGSEITKYELNGVSLRRINGITTSIQSPIDLDNYYVTFDRSSSKGSDRSADINGGSPQLSFNDLTFSGGNNIKASQNIIYNAVIPRYDIITPGSSTSVNASIRTVSGTSVSGNEASFNDDGYQSIQLNTLNSFDSVKLVCSEENQDEYLTGLPRKKSITTAIVFNSTDNMLSPILNLNDAASEFYINRLNNPISNYSEDNRVNLDFSDPHATVYYSNLINLRNPASSLKVILNAERPGSSDFRVLYSLVREDSSEVNQSFELFPGYDNLEQTTDGFVVIDSSKNSGLPDVKTPASIDGAFVEYEFTAENLDLFTGFTIKIVMSSTNQANSPRISSLSAIAIR